MVSVEIRKRRICLGRSFGVDIDKGNAESGEFGFPKNTPNITIGRKESKEGRHSERNSKQRSPVTERVREMNRG